MQSTSYQSPRKKERLELLKFNQTNSPHRYWFHHLRNTKGSAITALNITWWPMVSPYRIARSKNLWIELCWLKILETKQNKKQMKTLKRWKYDSMHSRQRIEYDVWHHWIRKPPFFRPSTIKRWIKDVARKTPFRGSLLKNCVYGASCAAFGWTKGLNGKISVFKNSWIRIL